MYPTKIPENMQYIFEKADYTLSDWFEIKYIG